MTTELFYSPVCPYCPQTRKVLWEIVEEFGEKTQVEEINVLSSTGLERAEKYDVSGVPTMIINGRTKVAGIPTRERLLKIIQQELTSLNIEDKP